MGICTVGAISINVKPRDIYNFIVQKFDKNADYQIKEAKCHYEEKPIAETGYIDFEYKGIEVSIDYKVSKTSEKLFNGLHGSLLTRKRDFSGELMTEILESFGGYLDVDNWDGVEIEETYIRQTSPTIWDEYTI